MGRLILACDRKGSAVSSFEQSFQKRPCHADLVIVDPESGGGCPCTHASSYVNGGFTPRPSASSLMIMFLNFCVHIVVWC